MLWFYVCVVLFPNVRQHTLVVMHIFVELLSVAQSMNSSDIEFAYALEQHVFLCHESHILLKVGLYSIMLTFKFIELYNIYNFLPIIYLRCSSTTFTEHISKPNFIIVFILYDNESDWYFYWLICCLRSINILFYICYIFAEYSGIPICLLI